MNKYIDVSPYDDCRIVCNSEDKGIPVKDIPTADVVEVVRCKDCKYFSEFHHCGVLGFCEPNEYCSRGERMDESATDTNVGSRKESDIK